MIRYRLTKKEFNALRKIAKRGVTYGLWADINGLLVVTDGSTMALYEKVDGEPPKGINRRLLAESIANFSPASKTVDIEVEEGEDETLHYTFRSGGVVYEVDGSPGQRDIKPIIELFTEEGEANVENFHYYADPTLAYDWWKASGTGAIGGCRTRDGNYIYFYTNDDGKRRFLFQMARRSFDDHKTVSGMILDAIEG